MAASQIDVEIDIEQRFIPHKGEEFTVHLYPSNSTHNRMKAWMEIKKEFPEFPYPEDKINKQDWLAI